MLSLYKMHLNRMFTRREFSFVVTVLLLILTGAFLESCYTVFGWFTSQLNSAALGWIMHMDQQPSGINTTRIFVFLLFGILASLIYGDAFFIDKREKMLQLAAIRAQGERYIISGALAAFTGAFITFFSFFVLSQLLALIVYPVHSSFSDYYAVAAWEDCLSRHPLFPELFFQAPYINNAVFMIYASVWAGLLAAMTYTASFLIPNRLLLLGFSQIFLILEAFLTLLPIGMESSIFYYLYPTPVTGDLSIVFFIIAPVAMLCIILVVFLWCLKAKKREIYL